MKIEQLIQRVESRLADLIVGDGSEERAVELALLRAEIVRHESELDDARVRRDDLATRVQGNSVTAALLPSQIEDSVRRGKSSQAMRQALELERLRRNLAEDRDELPRLEQTIWSLGFRLRQLRRQLAQLNAARPR